MSYIDRNLLAGERIIFRTKKSLMVFFFPVVWTIFASYATNYMHSQSLLQQLVWLPGALALFLWASSGIVYLSSDYVVTDKRVMMREGFFIRRTNEVRINTISQVNVDQSLLGQLLNYGVVILNAFGAQDAYTMISNPGEFQRNVNQQLNK
jgi:uncharacterized membrane protein YdbT with pleckstrin-like domain